MKKSNKGYSLVELLITMAIFSIIMLAIILMMRASLVSYKDGLFETTLQEEAQLAANQVSDLLIDARLITAINNSVGTEEYSFVGTDNNVFTLRHEGNNLWYGHGGSEELLSNQMKTFYISGLSRRAAGDTAEIYDNAATVNVGLQFQDRVYSASKDTYFRNNIENKSGSDEYDPFDVGTAPISSPSPSPSDPDTAEVLRFQPFDISAAFDIVADATLSTQAQGYFTLVESTNSTIKSPITGMTVKHYKVDVLDTYKSTTGFSLSSPASSDQITVTGKDSNGNEKTVRLHLSAVSFEAGSGIFEDYNRADVNQNGYPTNVKVKGIHVNEALKPTAQGGGGLNIKYSMTLKKGATTKGSVTDQTLSYNSSTTADQANSVPQLSPLDLKLGLVPDPVSGGFVITSSNGYRTDQKADKASLSNADGNQTLTITFKINNTNMTALTLNYKYYVTGNSLENAN